MRGSTSLKSGAAKTSGSLYPSGTRSFAALRIALYWFDHLHGVLQ